MATVEFQDEFASIPEWARMYRSLGLQVVPARNARPNDEWKRPALESWLEFRDNLTPDAVFDRWYGEGGEHVRRHSLGVITGRASGGVFVLDLDEYKPGGRAADWWRGVLAVHNNGMDIETPTQITGGGGTQRLFRAPAGWEPRTIKVPAMGVDIRGQGGFAMLPPSWHVSGRIYDWKPGLAPWEVEIAEAPPWLCEAIDQLHREYGGGTDTGPHERTPSQGPEFDAFGLRIDGREGAMASMVWAAVVDLARDCPIRPTQDVLDAEEARLWGLYLSQTKSRLTGPEYEGLGQAELLEREGRGRSLLHNKLSYAADFRWDEAIEAAQKPRPGGPLGTKPDPSGASGQPEPDAAPLPVIWSFAGEPPDRRWLVEEWIVEGAVNSLYSVPGLGKSLLAMQLGAAVSTGAPWLGLPTKQGRVLGVFCEDDPDELHRRIWAIRRASGCVLGYPFGEFPMVARIGQDNRLVQLDHHGNAAPGPFLSPLKATVAEVKPRLLILDTLAEVYGLNEVAREQVTFFLTGIVAQLGVTTLLLGHPSVASLADGRMYSGSSAWDAGVRCRMVLKAPENGAPEERVLERAKANYATSGEQTGLLLTWADGVFAPWKANDPATAGPESGSLQHRIERAVRAAVEAHQPYSFKRSHPRYVYEALPAELAKEGHPEAWTRAAISALERAERIITDPRPKHFGIVLND